MSRFYQGHNFLFFSSIFIQLTTNKNKITHNYNSKRDFDQLRYRCSKCKTFDVYEKWYENKVIDDRGKPIDYSKERFCSFCVNEENYQIMDWKKSFILEHSILITDFENYDFLFFEGDNILFGKEKLIIKRNKIFISGNSVIRKYMNIVTHTIIAFDYDEINEIFSKNKKIWNK